MSSLGVSTTVEQDHRHSSLIFRVATSRRLAGITIQTSRTEMVVTADDLTSRGDLGGYKPGELQMNWDRVRELHFAPPGAGEVGGLYAREGAHCSRCLLPRLTETQSTELLRALTDRFPQILYVVELDHETQLGHPYRKPATSLNLLRQRPTHNAISLSHALHRAMQSTIRREHESARRIYRGAAGPL